MTQTDDERSTKNHEKTVCHIDLTKKQALLLSAGLCVGTIASGTPEAFDGIQLSPRIQKSPGMAQKYAEACLLITDNYDEYQEVINKLSIEAVPP